MGEVTSESVQYAGIAGAHLIAFSLPHPREAVQEQMDIQGVHVLEYGVIYKLVDFVAGEMHRICPEQEIDNIVGHAQVLRVFNLAHRISDLEGETVAGCRIASGKLFLKQHSYKLVRGGRDLWRGKAMSMKHFKEVVEVVSEGMECGLTF